MRCLARLFLILAACLAAPAAAQQWVVVHEEEVIEEWIDGRWVEVSADAPAARFVPAAVPAPAARALASFGPFLVVDSHTAVLDGITDSRSPAAFAALLRAYPGVEVLEFADAPGTHDDIANLALGRMIRAAGLVTRVADGGSARSGAVELFLAGARREIAPGAEFAVHGWLDDRGLGAEDYPAGAPEHRRYLDYYAEMGMSPAAARAFYAMTNAVPFEQARWLDGAEMAQWLGQTVAEAPAPRLAYLDLGPALP